jgi:hypothetical protein
MLDVLPQIASTRAEECLGGERMVRALSPCTAPIHDIAPRTPHRSHIQKDGMIQLFRAPESRYAPRVPIHRLRNTRLRYGDFSAARFSFSCASAAAVQAKLKTTANAKIRCLHPIFLSRMHCNRKIYADVSGSTTELATRENFEAPLDNLRRPEVRIKILEPRDSNAMHPFEIELNAFLADISIHPVPPHPRSPGVGRILEVFE